VIFLFGEWDATVGEYLPERLAIISQASPTAVIEVIPDVGHWLMWEKPTLVADHLIRLAHP
jgi:pimeloyl-ACP methyl ester carboxylesterase